MMLVRQEFEEKERARISMIRKQETLSKINPKSRRQKAKKLPGIKVLVKIGGGARRRLNKMVASWSNRWELPPPTLTWQGADGYKIEVQDRRDVIAAYPGKQKKWAKKAMWQGVKLMGKGAKKLFEMAGEKSLPGQQRALYGTEIGEKTSFFGGAVVTALKGGAALDNR